VVIVHEEYICRGCRTGRLMIAKHSSPGVDLERSTLAFDICIWVFRAHIPRHFLRRLLEHADRLALQPRRQIMVTLDPIS
jgi:hypothetical protein